LPLRLGPAVSSRRGRPRLTPEDLRARLLAYCNRYGVALGGEVLPPFPSGRRESAQHREWMSLYKAHRRLSDRPPEGGDFERRHELLAAQRARCVICRKVLEIADARLDDHEPDSTVLHPQCLELVSLARRLGPEALERARTRAFP
jgi:hypothetical protein